MLKKTVYLDLNIFDRLEKMEKMQGPEMEQCLALRSLITSKSITTAYSNAHLNDLFRGYQKNPAYIKGHLENIQSLTQDLCICLYWGQKHATLHTRNIFDFFDSKLDEWEFEPNSYDDFFKDEPLIRMAIEGYKLAPLPDGFKKGYVDSMFGIMFPLSKIHNDYYALHSDIYNFQSRLKSDYSLYKSFKVQFITGLNKIKDNKNLRKALHDNSIDLPKHLEVIDILNAFPPQNNINQNDLQSKIIDTFFKYDLAGYKTDGHYNNMFDDALHTYYAAHFDYFITNDGRCRYKAEKTFQRLKIGTRVLKVDQIQEIQNAINAQ